MAVVGFVEEQLGASKNPPFLMVDAPGLPTKRRTHDETIDWGFGIDVSAGFRLCE